MDALAVLFGAAGLIVAMVAVAISLGVAVRLKGLEEATIRPPTGLAAGSAAPAEPLTRMFRGDSTWLNDSLLLFVSPGCEPCRSLLAGLRGRLSPTATKAIAIETPSPSGDSLAPLIDDCVIRVVDEGEVVRDAFRTHTTPHAFLIRDGVVANQVLGPDVDKVLAMTTTVRNARAA